MITATAIVATVSEPGQRPEDITLHKNCGGGHLDLFVARHLLDKL